MAKSLKQKPEPKALSLLAKNLKALMDQTPELGKQAKLASAAGVAQTSIGLMLKPELRLRTVQNVSRIRGPRLADVEKVAHAFGVEAWQLLIDPQALGDTLGKALAGVAATDEQLKAAKIEAAPPHPLKAQRETS